VSYVSVRIYESNDDLWDTWEVRDPEDVPPRSWLSDSIERVFSIQGDVDADPYITVEATGDDNPIWTYAVIHLWDIPSYGLLRYHIQRAYKENL
jgi:hypothetical protein